MNEKKYFVNVGFNLANKIVELKEKDGLDEDSVSQNPWSIFIRGVGEKAVLATIKNFKNIKSTDCIDLDMALIKNITECIAKPLTRTFNQSFLTSIFTCNMKKRTKVILIFKSEDKHLFSNYRPISSDSDYGLETWYPVTRFTMSCSWVKV